MVEVWFFIIVVLFIMYGLTDGFDLGAGTIYPFVAKTDTERRMVLNALGPLWDANEVWLLTAGGASFAAFPEFYALGFSSFYMALFLVLLALIVRAAAFEFRSKAETEKGRATWDTIFFLGSATPALLLGVALGNGLAKLPIKKIVENGAFAGFKYTESFPINFLNLINPFNAHGIYGLAAGVLTLTFFMIHGAIWLMMRTTGPVAERSKNIAKKTWWVFITFFILVTIWGLLKTQDGVHYLFKYPVIEIIFILIALISAILIYVFINKDKPATAFLFSALFIIFALSSVAVGLFPTMVPSSYGAAHNLTIYDASSSKLTLTIMIIVAGITTPIVLAYQYWVYRMFYFKVDEKLISELEKEGEGY